MDCLNCHTMIMTPHTNKLRRSIFKLQTGVRKKQKSTINLIKPCPRPKCHYCCHYYKPILYYHSIITLILHYLYTVITLLLHIITLSLHYYYTVTLVCHYYMPLSYATIYINFIFINIP